jgi:hypothetical protein
LPARCACEAARSTAHASHSAGSLARSASVANSLAHQVGQLASHPVAKLSFDALLEFAVQGLVHEAFDPFTKMTLHHLATPPLERAVRGIFRSLESRWARRSCSFRPTPPSLLTFTRSASALTLELFPVDLPVTIGVQHIERTRTLLDPISVPALRTGFVLGSFLGGHDGAHHKRTRDSCHSNPSSGHHDQVSPSVTEIPQAPLARANESALFDALLTGQTQRECRLLRERVAQTLAAPASAST